MLNKKFLLVLCLLTVFIAGCQQEIKTYKVKYKENFPVGTFKAVIGNQTIFTNGNEILEVTVKKNLDFFCYSVNKRPLCRLGIDVKVNDAAASKYMEFIQNLKEKALKSGKSRTTLPERLNYYLNNEKLEVEDVIFIKDAKEELVNDLQVPVIGKGNSEKEAKEDAIKKSDELVSVLIDKPK
mgnify:CR=1 FL=1